MGWLFAVIWTIDLVVSSFISYERGRDAEQKNLWMSDRQRYDMIHIWRFQDDGLATVASILIWKLQQRSLSSCSWKWCCRKGSALERPPSVFLLFFLKPLDLDSW